MQPTSPYSIGLGNNPYFFQDSHTPHSQPSSSSQHVDSTNRVNTQKSEKEELVATKPAQNGKPVEFYYDKQDGVSIRIKGQHVKKEDLPSDFRNIGSKEALARYLDHAFIDLKDLSNGDKKVNISQRLLGGGKKLKQPGHGVTYVVLRRGEDISEIKLELTDKDENTIVFSTNNKGTTLRHQNIDFNSAVAFPEGHPKRIMSRLCLEGDRLNSDQKYWVLVDGNNGKVSCGFGEVCDVATLCTMQMDKAKLQKIQSVEFTGKDSQGDDLKKTEDRLVVGGLIKGGAMIVDDGKLSVEQDEIKTVNLPSPVKHLMREMTAVEEEIEKHYGKDIWDKIQASLDSGILRKMVEDKKKDIREGGGPLKQNQAYIRIGFGDNYRGGPGHRMVIELWPAEHESPVHQHSSSYSYIKIMKGEVVNTNYAILSDCEIGKAEIAKEILREGNRTWLSPEQNQVHKIENKTHKGVISFHGYRYGEKGNQELTGVFDLIDKDGKYKEGGAVMSHWDAFAEKQGYPKGIEGFLKTMSVFENPISPGLNIEGGCVKDTCNLYQKRSIQKIGLGNYQLGDVVFDALCPSCSNPIDSPNKIIFENCRYTIISKHKNRSTEIKSIRISGDTQHSFDITNWFSASIKVEQ